uniref:GLTSCR1 domain-containing protein n=1 Tax=Rhabditophanes sp. KR3021 TaxID=114890 RepID=A0AC35TYN0_9BILA
MNTEYLGHPNVNGNNPVNNSGTNKQDPSQEINLGYSPFPTTQEIVVPAQNIMSDAQGLAVSADSTNIIPPFDLSLREHSHLIFEVNGSLLPPPSKKGQVDISSASDVTSTLTQSETEVEPRQTTVGNSLDNENNPDSQVPQEKASINGSLLPPPSKKGQVDISSASDVTSTLTQSETEVEPRQTTVGNSLDDENNPDSQVSQEKASSDHFLVHLIQPSIFPHFHQRDKRTVSKSSTRINCTTAHLQVINFHQNSSINIAEASQALGIHDNENVSNCQAALNAQVGHTSSASTNSHTAQSSVVGPNYQQNYESAHNSAVAMDSQISYEPAQNYQGAANLQGASNFQEAHNFQEAANFQEAQDVNYQSPLQSIHQTYTVPITIAQSHTSINAENNLLPEQEQNLQITQTQFNLIQHQNEIRSNKVTIVVETPSEHLENPQYAFVPIQRQIPNNGKRVHNFDLSHNEDFRSELPDELFEYLQTTGPISNEQERLEVEMMKNIILKEYRAASNPGSSEVMKRKSNSNHSGISAINQEHPNSNNNGCSVITSQQSFVNHGRNSAIIHEQPSSNDSVNSTIIQEQQFSNDSGISAIDHKQTYSNNSGSSVFYHGQPFSNHSQDSLMSCEIQPHASLLENSSMQSSYHQNNPQLIASEFQNSNNMSNLNHNIRPNIQQHSNGSKIIEGRHHQTVHLNHPQNEHQSSVLGNLLQPNNHNQSNMHPLSVTNNHQEYSPESQNNYDLRLRQHSQGQLERNIVRRRLNYNNQYENSNANSYQQSMEAPPTSMLQQTFNQATNDNYQNGPTQRMEFSNYIYDNSGSNTYGMDPITPVANPYLHAGLPTQERSPLNPVNHMMQTYGNNLPPTVIPNRFDPNFSKTPPNQFNSNFNLIRGDQMNLSAEANNANQYIHSINRLSQVPFNKHLNVHSGGMPPRIQPNDNTMPQMEQLTNIPLNYSNFNSDMTVSTPGYYRNPSYKGRLVYKNSHLSTTHSKVEVHGNLTSTHGSQCDMDNGSNDKSNDEMDEPSQPSNTFADGCCNCYINQDSNEPYHRDMENPPNFNDRNVLDQSGTASNFQESSDSMTTNIYSDPMTTSIYSDPMTTNIYSDPMSINTYSDPMNINIHSVPPVDNISLANFRSGETQENNELFTDRPNRQTKPKSAKIPGRPTMPRAPRTTTIPRAPRRPTISKAPKTPSGKTIALIKAARKGNSKKQTNILPESQTDPNEMMDTIKYVRPVNAMMDPINLGVSSNQNEVMDLMNGMPSTSNGKNCGVGGHQVPFLLHHPTLPVNTTHIWANSSTKKAANNIAADDNILYGMPCSSKKVFVVRKETEERGLVDGLLPNKNPARNKSVPVAPIVPFKEKLDLSNVNGSETNMSIANMYAGNEMETLINSVGSEHPLLSKHRNDSKYQDEKKDDDDFLNQMLEGGLEVSGRNMVDFFNQLTNTSSVSEMGCGSRHEASSTTRKGRKRKLDSSPDGRKGDSIGMYEREDYKTLSKSERTKKAQKEYESKPPTNTFTFNGSKVEVLLNKKKAECSKGDFENRVNDIKDQKEGIKGIKGHTESKAIQDINIQKEVKLISREKRTKDMTEQGVTKSIQEPTATQHAQDQNKTEAMADEKRKKKEDLRANVEKFNKWAESGPPKQKRQRCSSICRDTVNDIKSPGKYGLHRSTSLISLTGEYASAKHLQQLYIGHLAICRNRKLDKGMLYESWFKKNKEIAGAEVYTFNQFNINRVPEEKRLQGTSFVMPDTLTDSIKLSIVIPDIILPNNGDVVQEPSDLPVQHEGGGVVGLEMGLLGTESVMDISGYLNVGSESVPNVGSEMAPNVVSERPPYIKAAEVEESEEDEDWVRTRTTFVYKLETVCCEYRNTNSFLCQVLPSKVRKREVAMPNPGNSTDLINKSSTRVLSNAFNLPVDNLNVLLERETIKTFAKVGQSYKGQVNENLEEHQNDMQKQLYSNKESNYRANFGFLGVLSY